MRTAASPSDSQALAAEREIIESFQNQSANSFDRSPPILLFFTPESTIKLNCDCA